MERLKCEACAGYSMVPMEVMVTGEDETPLREVDDSSFYTCHVCGDNWLSLNETLEDGDRQVTFIHQMGVTPILKRIASLRSTHVLQAETTKQWSYYLGDDKVTREAWNAKLRDRRKVLKSICCN